MSAMPGTVNNTRAPSRLASAPSGANVRQMLGRGEAWGAESGNPRLVMVPAR